MENCIGKLGKVYIKFYLPLIQQVLNSVLYMPSYCFSFTKKL